MFMIDQAIYVDKRKKLSKVKSLFNFTLIISTLAIVIFEVVK